MSHALCATLLAWVLAGPQPALAAVDPDRDFSGTWVLDEQASDTGNLPEPPDPLLTVTHGDTAVKTVARSGAWSFPTDGTVSRRRTGSTSWSIRTKWEGAALLTSTLVSGDRNLVIMDRWRLSKDRSTLTIRRRVMRGAAESESLLVYRRQGQAAASAPPPNQPAALAERPPAPPEAIVVPAGTRIPLALQTTVSSKHSREGDRVYFTTVFPVLVGGRIVVPQGSHVAGTLTSAKSPGRVSGKGELFIRFDSLTLPNGVNRDFRSRLETADAGAGSVDREEGKVIGPGGKSSDARRVGEAAGAGAAVGTVAGAASGHYGMGAGIGAAAGAAAGLASVLLGRGPDAVLQKGASVEMVLDRDLRFTPREIQ